MLVLEDLPEEITMEWLKAKNVEHPPFTNAELLGKSTLLLGLPTALQEEYFQITNEAGNSMLHVIIGSDLAPFILSFKRCLTAANLMKRNREGLSGLEIAVISGNSQELPYQWFEPVQWIRHLEHLRYLVNRKRRAKDRDDDRKWLQEFVNRVEALAQLKRAEGLH